MREIEFRGKTVPQLLSCKKDENGNWVQKYTESEWVYGYYAPVYLCERDGKIQNKYAIISDEFIGQPEMIGKNVNTGLPKMFEILENTLGQYTGLKDKNGKKIFEGDIIHIEEENLYGLICFENCQWYVYYYGWIDKEGIGYVYDIVNENPLADELLTNENKIWLSVVGNKYDNPELLEAEK